MATSVEIEILAEVKKASATIEKFAKQSEKQLGGIKAGIDTTSLATSILAATAVVKPLISALTSAASEALEAEKSNTRLAQSMKVVGDFTQSALDQFDAFAGALQKQSGIQDDVIKANAALAKSYGLTNKEAQLAIKAAVELSAVTGESLDSAIVKVSESFNGNLNKSLGKLLPGLKGLTQEQLVAGEAARKLEERFRGSAAAAQDTFAGSLNKVALGFKDILKTTGEFITKNQGFKTFLDVLAEKLGKVNEVLKDLDKPKNFGLLRVDPEVLKQIDALSGKTASANTAARRTNISQDQIKQIKDLGNEQIAQQKRLQEARAESNKQLAQDVEKIQLDSFKSVASEQEKVALDFAPRFQRVQEAISKGAIKDRLEGERLIFELQKELQAKLFQARQKELEQTIQSPFKSLFGTRNQSGSILNLNKDQEEFTAIATAFGRDILKGAEGAVNFISSGLAEGIGALLGSAFAGPAKEIIGVLAQGPDKVREQVKAFTDALPQIVKNIIEAIPELITALIDSIPALIDAIIAEIPKLIESLVRALPEIAVKLAELMPLVSLKLAEGIIKNLPQIISAFTNGLVQAAPEFVKALIESLSNAGNIGKGIVGGVGDAGGGLLSGIGDFFGGIGDIFGFAEGGRVPLSPKFSNDGFGPVKLDAGEQILNGDLSGKLENFLNGQTSQPTTVNIVIGQQQLASVLLDLNRGGFRTS